MVINKIHLTNSLNSFKSKKLIFGPIKVPFKIEDEILLEVNKEEKELIYRREWQDNKVKKVIGSNINKILINPVEPLNLLKSITSFFLTEFEKTLLIGPKKSKEIFLKFPVEIGVFISEKENFELIDVFSLANPKYTLYGDPKNGVICRYWKTDIFTTKPQINPKIEGIMNLKIKNSTAQWEEIKTAVFNGNGMKIYYNNELVSLIAKLKIIAKNKAETEFVNAPLEKNMKKSEELFSPKGTIIAKKFIMEEGL